MFASPLISVSASADAMGPCPPCRTLPIRRLSRQAACCVKGYVDASFMAKGAEMERLVADLGLSNDPSSNL